MISNSLNEPSFIALPKKIQLLFSIVNDFILFSNPLAENALYFLSV